MIPAAIHCASLAVMWRYPLTEDRHKRFKARLARKANRLGVAFN